MEELQWQSRNLV